MNDELDSSKEWARQHLKCRTAGAKGVAAVVHAEAELPLPPLAAFQLMAHPDNAAIFRGIERCTYRKVLWAASVTGPADGSMGSLDAELGSLVGGAAPAAHSGYLTRAAAVPAEQLYRLVRQTVEVENESDWHFLFCKGSIKTRMLVHEDPCAGTIHVRLAAGGTAPLELMTGKWKFGPGSQPGTCLVTLDQEVHPKKLPPFFHNGFRAMAGLQVRKTFEDLYAEALRMNEGKASLAPYHSVAQKQIASDAAAAEADADEGAAPPHGSSRLSRVKGEPGSEEEDPSSVLAAAYDGSSSCSSGAASPPGFGLASQRRSGAAFAAAAQSGLRSHPIASLLDLGCLAGATGASLAAEAADNAAVAAQEAAAAAAKEAGAAFCGWRRRAYELLQLLWSASNAALGMAPDAVEQLEEMAVLV